MLGLFYYEYIMTNTNPTKRLENLKYDFTHEQYVENGKKGGKKTAEVYANRRLFKEAFKAYLSMQDENALEGMDQTNLDGIIIAMGQKAKGGDVPAATFIRDTVGEKPTEKQEIDIGPLKKLEVEIKE